MLLISNAARSDGVHQFGELIVRGSVLKLLPGSLHVELWFLRLRSKRRLQPASSAPRLHAGSGSADRLLKLELFLGVGDTEEYIRGEFATHLSSCLGVQHGLRVGRVLLVRRVPGLHCPVDSPR